MWKLPRRCVVGDGYGVVGLLVRCRCICWERCLGDLLARDSMALVLPLQMGEAVPAVKKTSRWGNSLHVLQASQRCARRFSDWT